MLTRVRLGILTPSSNTVLEPLTSAMVSVLPGVSAHFARFEVTEISLTEEALGQFDDSKILQAASLLAQARVDVIGWSGTSSSWLGFEADRRLRSRITEATGIPATTSVSALNEILGKTGVKTLGLVTPYLKVVQERIVANYVAAGIDVVAERHLGLSENFAFAEVGEDQIEHMARAIGGARPDAIAVLCTNLRAAQMVPRLEAELGIPVYDSVATVVWRALRTSGVDTPQMKDWGRLFGEVV